MPPPKLLRVASHAAVGCHVDERKTRDDQQFFGHVDAKKTVATSCFTAQ